MFESFASACLTSLSKARQSSKKVHLLPLSSLVSSRTIARGQGDSSPGNLEPKVVEVDSLQGTSIRRHLRLIRHWGTLTKQHLRLIWGRGTSMRRRLRPIQGGGGGLDLAASEAIAAMRNLDLPVVEANSAWGSSILQHLRLIQCRTLIRQWLRSIRQQETVIW